MSLRKSCPKCGETYDESIAFCAKDGSSLVVVDESGLIGKMIGGRYRVISRIGEGGMGQVYLAEHVRMKRKSAIKIMRPALLHEQEALQRFTREAENASKITHPNVAAIFDFGETDDGLVYLAMEFVDGESLAATLKREVALHAVVGADIIAQAADALQSAHDLGILHRDIKPDNVLVSKRADGTFVVKLVWIRYCAHHGARLAAGDAHRLSRWHARIHASPSNSRVMCSMRAPISTRWRWWRSWRSPAMKPS